MIVHIKRNETTWETFTAASGDEALGKIRQQYPKAANRSQGIDGDTSLPAGKVMYVYEAQDSPGHSSRLVARIRAD